MNLKNLYLVNAAICLLFAIGLLLMPSVMVGLFGMTNTKYTELLAQLVAVELTFGGLTTLLARDVTDLKARTAINIANLAAGVIGVVVSLNGILTGAWGWFGYVALVIYAFVAIAFGYFQFFGPRD